MMYHHDVRREKPLYFPVDPSGISMRPGLFKLDTDFGNGDFDHRYFQRCQHDFNTIFKSKLSARHANFFAAENADDHEARRHIMRWMCMQNYSENYVDVMSEDPCAIARSISEDFAIVRLVDNIDRVTMLHVSHPTGWDPAHVIGRSFKHIHDCVPSFKGNAENIVHSMVHKGPFVRFVWSLRSSDELNNHPGVNVALDAGGPLYLRVERQVIVPFKEQSASLFLIRIYMYDCFSELNDAQRQALVSSLRSLSDDVAKYKGFYGHIDRICDRLVR